jgi:hypothetical protein
VPGDLGVAGRLRKSGLQPPPEDAFRFVAGRAHVQTVEEEAVVVGGARSGGLGEDTFQNQEPGQGLALEALDADLAALVLPRHGSRRERGQSAGRFASVAA